MSTNPLRDELHLTALKRSFFMLNTEKTYKNMIDIV